MFRFKEFSVRHDSCGMKVGTDAVLLGAWVNTAGAKKILDIGTGCGVIALMLAQRTDLEVAIDAVEIEAQDATQAAQNISESPWPTKIAVHQKAIQEFEPGYKYDLIVSNPPFFNDSLLPPLQKRAQARHTQTLRYDELIFHSLRLLSPKGKLAVILPFREGKQFNSLSNQKGLFVNRQLSFSSRKEKPQERWLFEYSMSTEPIISEELVLYDSNGEKSTAYRTLTDDFYL